MRHRILLATSLAAVLAACGSSQSVVGGVTDVGAPTDAFDASLDVFDAPSAPDVVDAPSAPDVVDAPDVPLRCARNEDCAGNPLGAVCDTASGRCVRCVPSADTCPAGQYCDGASNTCAPGCRNDEGCAAPAGDAGASGGSRCNVMTRRCVQCVRDEHCPLGNLCVGEVCVTGCSATQACPAGQSCCGGACVDAQANIAHCGVCDRRCAVANGAPACMNGTCAVASCATGYGDCDGDAGTGCETDTRESVTHCGRCGNACPVPAHATATCAGGACGFRCDAGFADCDGNAGNGCEVDLSNDTSHCGGCATRCDPANAVAACVMGRCAIARCNGNALDCDGNAANGCETDSATSVSHCGMCMNACPAPPNGAPVCVGARCRFTCVAGYSNCDSDDMNGCETDTRTSATHCGTCGRTCAPANATGACVASICTVSACAAGFSDCDGNAANGCEASPRTDRNHCGACNNRCPAGDVCVAGACQRTLTSTGCGRDDGGTAPGGNTLGRFCVVTGGVGVLSGALPSGARHTLRLPLDAVPSGARIAYAFLYRQTYDQTSTYLTAWSLGGTDLMPLARRIGLRAPRPHEAWRADITQIVRDAPRATDGSVSLPLVAAPTDSSGGFGWWLVYEDRSLPERTVMVYDGMHTDLLTGNGAFAFEGLNVGAPVLGSVAIYGGGDGFNDASSTARFTGPRGVLTFDDVTEPSAGNYAGVSRWDVFAALSPGMASPTLDFTLRNDSAVTFAALDVTAAVTGTTCDPACPTGQTCYGGRCYAPRTCRELRAVSPTAESGPYTLDLDGPGGENPIGVYCDMDTDGGGWTWLGTMTNFGDAANVGNWLVTSPTPNNWESPTASFGPVDPTLNQDVRSPAFGRLRGRAVMITHRNQFLLRTYESCVPDRTLASHFASLAWTCGGSESFANYPRCTNPCVITRATPRTGDVSLLAGTARARLFLKAGEADGAQDTNRDRAYFSTEYRDNVDYSPGLGAFCSGIYCTPRTGEADVNGRSDAITPAPGTEFYGVWIR